MPNESRDPTRRRHDEPGSLAEVWQAVLHIRELTKTQMKARDKALVLALAGLNKRLVAMNEFRMALQDQTGRFVTREEWSSGASTRDRDIEALKLALAGSTIMMNENEKHASAARAALDTRLTLMNEFRQQIKDQTATFVTRDTSDVAFAAVIARMAQMDLAAKDLMPRNELENRATAFDGRVKVMESKLANWDGRLWMFGALFTIANVFMSWYLAGAHIPK